MRKNKMMRAASGLLVATLLTTCVISGTFAKYTTTTSGSDKARVATWGFTQSSTINLDDLFMGTYTNVQSGNAEDVLAPGTTSSDTFDFTYAGEQAKPEVKYQFTVSTDGSEIDADLKSNPNILWKLDNGEWGNWDALMASIKLLSGDASGTKAYDPGELPTAFNAKAANTHTITWKWIFDENATDKEATTANNDVNDTKMGNAAELDDVNISISITATQID